MPDALHSALHSAAFAPLTGGWLRVTGDDRVRWLNGMVTNSIQALTPGQGCYNFVLNAQGRIQADCTAWLEPESILLQTADPAALRTLFDRFIIMDDVELELLGPPHEHVGVLIAGPEAPAVLAGLGLPLPEPMHLARAGKLAILQSDSPLIPRFELWAPAGELPSLTLPLLSPETLTQLRLLEGTPLAGIDIRDKDLPQETAQTRALHFSKGCYLGQEIVERIRSRGQVHRTLHGFRLTGGLPAPGTPVSFEGKPIGELTSAALVPLESPLTLALGIVRREAIERCSPENPISYPGGTAQPVSLPYKPA